MRHSAPRSICPHPIRSATLAILGFAAAFILPAGPSHAEDLPWRHGAALLGELKYPPDFKRFDYVNPDAPKGGTLRLSTDGTFDSFNPLIPKGNPAAGVGLIYEQLMTPSLDEVSTEYGEIAEALQYPPDFAWAKYRLRPEAKWHDGKPITPDDVVWSFEATVANNPSQAFYYRHVKKVEATGEHEVTFTFDQTGNRELPQIIGQLTVLPKHWWTGTGPDGQKRDITRTTLEIPLGSGPYRLKEFSPGRSVTYERVKDYWGKDLAVNVGQNNFDQIRYEYFRDDQVELEAFKGDNYDARFENSAKNWATAYDFPARQQGRVVLEKLTERGSGVMVGFVPNLRRPIFQDPRVRQALNLAMPFEDMNRTTFFGQYERISSYFYPTELGATGVPQGAELAMLNEAKDKGPIPAEVFTKPYTNPVAADATAERTNLREALKLLGEAGWTIEGTKLVNAKKEPFRIEFLMNGPTFERVGVRYREQLAKIGIDLTIRSVDSSQYQNRVRSRDFDLIYTGWGQSLSPGNEQNDFFGSEAADREGSRNYAGIKNPAIDYLIKRVIFAKDRTELVDATHALDRVLLWNHYVIPGWTTTATRMARWDRFSHPATLPKYSTGFPTIWWWDATKAAKTGAPK